MTMVILVNYMDDFCHVAFEFDCIQPVRYAYRFLVAQSL